jgi:hypothetical protein
VAEGLHGAFEQAGVVAGFWGASCQAFTGAGSLADVAHLRWIQLTSADWIGCWNSVSFSRASFTTVSGHATPIGEFVISRS